MASKHGSKPKRDKKHRPKPTNPEANYFAIRDNWRAKMRSMQEGAQAANLHAEFSQNVGESEQAQLSHDYRTAFVAMLTGGADLGDWSDVTNALNTALILCERGFGEEYTTTVIEALAGLFSARLHFEAAGEWRFSEAARSAINDSLDVHAAQLEIATQADCLSAFAEISRRIDQNNVMKVAA